MEISAVGHLHLCSQVDMMDVCHGKPDGCYDFEESINLSYTLAGSCRQTSWTYNNDKVEVKYSFCFDKIRFSFSNSWRKIFFVVNL